MPAAQIYSVVNTIAGNIKYTGSTVVDVSSFVAFAQDALSDTLKTEGVYNTLIDLIGRTIIATDEAEDDERGIVIDSSLIILSLISCDDGSPDQIDQGIVYSLCLQSI